VSIEWSHPPHGEMSPEFALMGFLYFEDLHGYELHRRLQASLREVWRIPQNQAYNLLKRMEKEGLAEPASQQPDTSGARGRTTLTLTAQGRERFTCWLYATSPCSARAGRVELLTRLFFASQIDAELPARLMREQLEAVRMALAGLEARRAALPEDETYNRAALDIRVAQMKTLQTWLKSNENFFRG